MVSNLLNTDSKVKREYMVLRNHEGEVTPLAGTFADDVITFETDCFSDYAIAWKDTAVVFIVKYKCRKLQTKNVGRCNYIL